MTFYKSISENTLANTMPLSLSIISNMLDAMFLQMNPFLNKTDMMSVGNITKTLIEKNSTAWSRMSPNFYPIREITSLNLANKKFDSFLNFRELLSKSSAILFHSILKLWNDTLCNLETEAFPKNCAFRSWISIFF